MQRIIMALQRIAGKETFPKDVVEKFTKLGALQRGKPEHAMINFQKYFGGGVLPFVMEHVGDLTHRMTHMIPWGNLGGEYVIEKAEKTLKTLKSGYGFRREHLSNLKNNSDYFKIPIDEFKKHSEELAKKYTLEHQKLPVYNKAQWLAREAAVAVGKMDFDRATLFLETLLKLAKSDDYCEEAASAKRDSSGEIIEYKP